MMQEPDYYFEDLKLGMRFEEMHTVTPEDIQKFAEVTGDFNPLHFDDGFAQTQGFDGRIAHGALTASFVSGILGNKLPGAGSVFAGLDMRFKRPIYPNQEFLVYAEVKEMMPRGFRVIMSIGVIARGKKAAQGEAMVIAKSRQS